MPHQAVSAVSSLKNHSTGVWYQAVEHGHGVDSEAGCSDSEDEMSTMKQNAGNPPKWTLASIKQFLRCEVDGSQVAPLLNGFAFMTGFIDAVTFTSIFVWSGFQTGNFAQVAIALANTIEAILKKPHSLASYTIPATVQQAICSLAAFLIGVLLFGRIGDWAGPHKRGWLCGGTLVQAFLTLLSGFIFCQMDGGWTRPVGHPGSGAASQLLDLNPVIVGLEHFLGIACLSASFGVQGVMARRLNTAYGTTVVLTGVFVDLVSDPTLFQLSRPVQARDEMYLASISLFCGVVAGKLVVGQLGVALTIAVGALMRAGLAAAWLMVPAAHVHLP